jgi:hypothetical protein
MTHDSADSDDQAPVVPPKTRRCLRCRATFESDWAGNRVCKTCKNSGTWRSDKPL